MSPRTRDTLVFAARMAIVLAGQRLPHCANPEVYEA